MGLNLRPAGPAGGGASAVPPPGAPGSPPTFEELGGWPGVLGRLVAGRALEVDEAACVMGQVLEGKSSPAQVGAFLVALRSKGETVDEMTGLVRSLMAHAEPLEVPGDVVDVVGTGGDRLASINVSTLAACVAAGAGATVCKHGNRAASSSVGTADVLGALGVCVDLGPAGVARCVAEVGIGFCFAPRFHPAMRFAGPVRSELGVPTVFNFLGPLANPARARFQLVGVSDPAMAPKMAAVLGQNGSRRAMVVYADDGLDELSVTSPSTVLEVIAAATPGPGRPPGAVHEPDAGGDGRVRKAGDRAAVGPTAGDVPAYDVRTWRLVPADLGFAPATMADLRGGDAAFNAGAIRRVLDGERSPRRDIGVLNAAAALVVAGCASSLEDGVAQASASVDSKKALAVLEGLVRVSNEAAAEEQATRADRPPAPPG